ncbi:MAG: hypothetical protein RLZZ312_1048 [Bacteroidota bacterium]
MWTEKNNQLKRSFEFKNFIDAFAFMTKVALISEKMNHHPNGLTTITQYKLHCLLMI